MYKIALISGVFCCHAVRCVCVCLFVQFILHSFLLLLSRAFFIIFFYSSVCFLYKLIAEFFRYPYLTGINNFCIAMN